MLIFIAGATGFVGSHLVRAVKEKGSHKLRCLLRNPKKAPLCMGFETVGGSLSLIPPRAMEGVDMVVHLVGIIREEKGGDTFESVHVRGTENLVNAAIKAGVRRFFYQSALGASIKSASGYLKSKAEAEEIVKDSGIPYTIFRPSLILGEGDGFTKQILELIKLSPVVPIAGDGKSLFQPLYIGDWVKCFMGVLDKPSESLNRTFELGGPEQISFNGLIDAYMDVLGLRRKTLHIPLGIVKAGIDLLGVAQAAGLKSKRIPPVTKEQLALLSEDNITELDSVKKHFGFEPVAVRQSLEKFLPPPLHPPE